MGRYRSGERFQTKLTTEAYVQMDVRKWYREGWLTNENDLLVQWFQEATLLASVNVRAVADHVVLAYRHISSTGTSQDLQYSVSIAWTRCNYGGLRPWFICPEVNCRRRVAILYGSGVFTCRHCSQLVYATQRQAECDRAVTKAQKIRIKLGGDGNLIMPFPPRPKGMHNNTYLHFQRKEAIAQASVGESISHFNY